MDRHQLEHAIATLDAQRAALGDAVVDASVAALREKLAGLSSSRAGEQRKLVTILFADLVDWTRLAGQMDPEDVRAVQVTFFDTIKPIIVAYGGAVEKYIGDAVLAVFGVPQAREDDAERAVRAGLAMQQAVAGLNDRLRTSAGRSCDVLASGSLTLSLRIGIHSGLVLAWIGQGPGEFTVTGDAVNLASRLQAAARPGTVLISEDSYRLVSHAFDGRPLPGLRLKGIERPVTAFRVTAPAPESSLRPSVCTDVPLVGRGAEMAALCGALRRLHGGKGGIVTVVGEAGIGKSRLVAELHRWQLVGGEGHPDGQRSERARDALPGEPGQRPSAGAHWLEGRCHSYGSTIPFHLWMDVLRHAAGVPVDATTERLDRRIRDWIQRYCPTDCDQVYPALVRLLPLAADADGLPSEQTHAEGWYSKQAVFTAVETLVSAGSANQPLVIVCEDMQWADPSSVELLERLVSVATQRPVLLICIWRPNACQPVQAFAERLATSSPRHHTHLQVGPLSRADSEVLVGKLLEGVPALAAGGRLAAVCSPENLWPVLRRAEGNPFFLQEAMGTLIAAGILGRDDLCGGWRLAADPEGSTIPDSVQAVLGARIDNLEPPARHVLQMAAVVGREFSAAVLAAVVPQEVELQGQLDALVRQGLIIEREIAAGREYRFRQALVQEVAYAGLPRSQRRRGHRMVAEALERSVVGGLDTQVEALAWHWQGGGQPARALPYLIQAGDRARRLGASREAIAAYETALELLDQLPVDAPAAPYELHERLGDVYLEHLSDQEHARDHFSAFLAQAEAPEDRARGARKVGSIDLLQGDLAAADSHFQAALSLLEDLPGETTEANRVHCGLAYRQVSLGDLDRAACHIRQCVRRARRLHDRRGLADAYRIRGIIANRQADPGLALAYARRCLHLYEELCDLPQVVQACNNAADCCRQLGYARRADRYLEKGLALARQLGDTRDQALLLLTRAELLLDEGQVEEAVSWLEEALLLARASGAAVRIIQAHRILGTAYRRLGQVERARAHVETALTLCQETNFRRYTARLQQDLDDCAAAVEGSR